MKKNQIFQLVLSIKYRLNRYFHEIFFFKFFSKEKVFTSIWRNNYWGSDESLSGPGSTLEQTRNIREKLPELFNNMEIKSVFDAPCGDMHWMQHIIRNTNLYYLGGDIVSDIVINNQDRFACSKVKFIKFDMTTDKFPSADIWLCRAILYHLSNHDIYLALENFIKSEIKYILTTNCVTEDYHINKDIVTGDWRSLNLRLPPFNFPSNALWEIEDYVPPHPPMTLVLWSKEQIEEVMPSIRKLFKK